MPKNKVKNIRNSMPGEQHIRNSMASNKCCTSKKHYQERGASGKACEGQCEEHQEQHAKEGSTSGTACQGTSAVHQEKLARNKVRNIRTRKYRNKLRCIRNRMPVTSSTACQQQVRNVKNSMLRNKVSISRTCSMPRNYVKENCDLGKHFCI
jgi:hypothetical protein